MSELIEIVDGVIVAEAAQTAVRAGDALIKLAEKLIDENPKLAGVGLLMIMAGVSYGFATEISEFFKNSWFRWGSGEGPQTSG